MKTNKSPRRVTPQQQLWALTTPEQQECIRPIFRRLKLCDQQDLCYGLIAYLRFGIVRPYEDPFMHLLFDGFIELLEGRVKTH